MIRMIAAAALLAATLAAPSAFAQGSYRHHGYCLRGSHGLQCAFDSMQQCQVEARGAGGTCVRNTLPMNHPLRAR